MNSFKNLYRFLKTRVSSLVRHMLLEISRVQSVKVKNEEKIKVNSTFVKLNI